MNDQTAAYMRAAARIERLYGQLSSWEMDKLFDDDSTEFQAERMQNPDFARFMALRESLIDDDQYEGDLRGVTSHIIREEVERGALDGASRAEHHR